MASGVPRPSTSTTVVLRKRKRDDSPLVLRISSSPTPSYTASHSESEYEQSPHSPVISISLGPGPSRGHVKNKKKRYTCDFDGCDKSYSKPSRLAEHQRSHTGDRPFICATCQKSYLRESHLQAHSRSHLPESARPFVCEEAECGKRFWTSQHLRVHANLHKGEMPFNCAEPSCDATFAKQYQLREHICSTHAPPGTKSYRCDHDGCSKSFATNQKLRAHVKTHDEKRYTCVHASCLPAAGHPPTYFANWTALQHHMRTAHPPTCPYPSCSGKTFTAQKGLRAHLKIHAERDLEAELEKAEEARTGRRDFACSICGRTFGYKHLLQRHTAQTHPTEPVSSDSESEDDAGEISEGGTEGSSDEQEDDDPGGREETAKPSVTFSIDFITGAAYDTRSQARLNNGTRSLRCPFPDLPPSFCVNNGGNGVAADDGATTTPTTTGQPRCQYVFSRAYDLRRHLLAEHEVEVAKEVVDEWVKSTKAARANEAQAS
ncbi:hypothetical protein EVJ58_g5676 [Rhodofomes roseus]|uniref:C2H2-type domain-containing protein n=1 Tax=Rhodofomes roseus TaxID=34475 RepID=A0A4Y9YAU4_9APHY|nr:hypothetical protein EVJ58_g5676 [Rhodofomes roseus]